MKTYSLWIEQAKRFDKIVDFASPMSAWNPDMLKAHRLANGNINKAIEIYKGLKHGFS